MSKTLKGNSMVSMVAMAIAVVALVAGVYAVMQVNTNQNAGASATAEDSARCRVAVTAVATANHGEYVSACLKVLSGQTVAQACPRYNGTCRETLPKIMEKLPSYQCAQYTNIAFSLNECASVEAGDKTCLQVCGPKNTETKAKCTATCSKVAVRD